MSHLPFVKPKPKLAPLALPAPRRHNVYSPMCAPVCGPVQPISQFPKSPLKITFPWIQSRSTFIKERIEEYKLVYPLAGSPSNEDLLVWLYNRAVNAEHNARANADEVRRLEQEAGINSGTGI